MLRQRRLSLAVAREYELRDWLEQQPKPQLVFVRYSPDHNMNFEWVYNHADIMHSHVIWARDLGAEHNKSLLDLNAGPHRLASRGRPPRPAVDPIRPSKRPATPQNPARTDTEQEQLEWSRWNSETFKGEAAEHRGFVTCA